jgi:hypothetical protein
MPLIAATKYSNYSQMTSDSTVYYYDHSPAFDPILKRWNYTWTEKFKVPYPKTELELTNRSFNKYNSSMQLIESRGESKSSQWGTDYETTYTYTNWGGLESKNTKFGTSISRVTYTYNSSNQIIKEEYTNGTITNPYKYSIVSYSYNANGLIDTILTEDIARIGQIQKKRTINTYSGTLLMESVTNYSANANWTTNPKEVYTYDSKGRMLSKEIANSTMTLYEYDNNDNQTGVEYRSYNAATATYENSSKDEYAYNMHNQMVRHTQLKWNGIDKYIVIPNSTTYHYYYGTPPTTVNTVSKAAAIEIYPVPASDMIQVKYTRSDNSPATIYVHSVDGKLMKAVTTNSEITTVDVSSLPAGNYTVTLHNGQEPYTQIIAIAR